MGVKKSTTDARFSRLLQPVLDAIRELGGSARPSEVKEWIIRELKLPANYINAVNKGGESKFGNDVDWARFYLARAGYLDSSTRGVWSLTASGRRAKIDPPIAAKILRNVELRGSNGSPAPGSIGPSDRAETYIDQT